ncbi:MAG: adenylosuccinate lyase [Planctomycetia bacterium]|nr:adenylosuccinate lyase [Planctomycetia bacterium]
MEINRNEYRNPLISRYASKEMSAIWSEQRKFSTWRRLWVALAEAEAEMGLPISEEQLQELRAHVDDIDFDLAAQYERKLRHDVMAHVHTYGDACPNAKGIIHWGATSCYVTDNTDVILIRDSLRLLQAKLLDVMRVMAAAAKKYQNLPCLAFTHLQPAQPMTLGKRFCLWLYDLVMDLEDLEHRIALLRTRGLKGTTGTQASFYALFENDDAKVRKLEAIVDKKIDFESSFAVTGQTYPRKLDSQVLDVLSGLAQSAHKMATDLRILAHRKECEEPFEKNQIGSSAMAYKRNPMRSERICSLARFVMSLQSSPAMTLSTQWFERTLDDSANRRLVLPQAFLAMDAILILYRNVIDGMVVYPKVIEKNLRAELPFMATENIMMAATAAGGDRQEIHEHIRQHSQAASAVVKQEGGENDLMTRLAADPLFDAVDLNAALEPSLYVGRSPNQVDEFLNEIMAPFFEKYEGVTSLETEIFC